MPFVESYIAQARYTKDRLEELGIGENDDPFWGADDHPAAQGNTWKS